METNFYLYDMFPDGLALQNIILCSGRIVKTMRENPTFLLTYQDDDGKLYIEHGRFILENEIHIIGLPDETTH